MGFSLKRALLGAVVGGAHAAGEVYDAQLKEAAINRQRELNLAKQKELEAYRADIIMDREDCRDERKAERAAKDQETLGTNMKEINAAVRAEGLDPGSVKGLRAAAVLADEKGYTAIADKYRVRLEAERSHLANEENRKLQAEATREARLARIGSAGKEKENKSYEKFERLVLNDITKDFTVDVKTVENDKETVRPDRSAVPSARKYALDLYAQGMSPEQISVELNKQMDVMLNEHALDPSSRGLVALERGHERIAEHKTTQRAADESPSSVSKQFGSNTLVPEFTQFSTGAGAPKFGLINRAEPSAPQATQTPSPGLRPKEQVAAPVEQAGSGRYSAAGLPLDTGPSNVGTAPRAENIIDKAGNVIDVFTGGGQYGATVTPRGFLSRQ